MRLNNDDIDTLGARALGTPQELDSFLDEVIKKHELNQDHDSVNVGVLAFHPVEHRDALLSQDVARLRNVMAVGSVMDGVVACLRLLQMPKHFLDEESDCGVDALIEAQRHLSRTLVTHPVLLHNRIFVKSLCFADSEYAPIASIIGMTERAEFPRLAHGIGLEQIRSFARHHCVNTGLTKAAPKPSPFNTKMQGLTLLAAVSPLVNTPRVGLLVSMLELDNHRAASFAISKRPKSFLSARGKEIGRVHVMIARTFLSAFNISRSGCTAYDERDLISAFKGAGVAKDPCFLKAVEVNLHRWISMPADQVTASMNRLGCALLALAPAGLIEPQQADSPSMQHVVNWLASAVLDSSVERANAIGAGFKNFPCVGADKAVAFYAALDTLNPGDVGPDGSGQKVAARVLNEILGPHADVWRAAAVANNMELVIRSEESLVHQEDANIPARRRRAGI